MRCPVSACCLSCVRPFYTTQWGMLSLGGRDREGVVCSGEIPGAASCGAWAQRARGLPRASQAGGPIDRRFVFCFVRPHSLGNCKQEFREAGAPCQEISQISCDLSAFPESVTQWPGSWTRVCDAGLAAVCPGEGLGCARVGSGDWEEGDMTPHLFRAVPEGSYQFYIFSHDPNCFTGSFLCQLPLT